LTKSAFSWKFECDGYSGPPYSSIQILIRQP
jgi:hypothetical protein